MGRVYLARAEERAAGLEPGTRVALKVIHPHLLDTAGFFKRFLREAEIGRSVEHANVVRCYDCDAVLVGDVQQNFLVMEYVEGQTLRALLEDLGRVPEELCRHIGHEVARGLQAIHEVGVVHRDLKPDNVLITNEHVVKVMDLGVARLQDEAIRLSRTGAFVGSLEYASPEQLGADGGSVDRRADLHALGVILYELATGVNPFRADSMHAVLRGVLEVVPRPLGEVNPQITPFLEEVVRTLLAKERHQRFNSAADVARVLESGEKSTWWTGRAQVLRAEAKRPLRRVRIPRATALCGRDSEVARLSELYAQAKAGNGQVVLIDGEAGIGKTRLVDEFVGRLQQSGEDVNFLFGAYPPGGAATAMGAFTTAYRQHFGTEGLEDTLRAYLKITPRLVPAFGALLKGESTPSEGLSLTKDSLQTVFVHATRALSEERPTIVLIDDLHFAPQTGRALFASLALAVPEHRILLIGTMRRGMPEDWIANVERQEHAHRLSLARLGPKDLVQLLEEAFQSEDLAHQLCGKIAVKSDGNPFFAFEIIRGLREERLIERRPDGRWVTTSTIRDIQVPSAVLDLIQVRLGDIDEGEKDLLDVAACCGYAFDPLVVGEALGLERIPSLKRLARLETRRRLVRSVGDRFVFDHHPIQEALYDALPAPLAREYHTRIALVLEERANAAHRDPRELPGETCVEICDHRLRGARGTETDRYIDCALDHLERSYLHDRSAALAKRALDIPGLLTGARRVEVLLRVAGTLEGLGRREEERAVVTEAVAVAETLADRTLEARAHRQLGHSLERAYENEAALVELETALALAREAGAQRVVGAAHTCLGHVCHILERWDDAEAHHEQQRKLARELGDARTEAGATLNLGFLRGNRGRPEEARPYFESALALAEASGDRQIEAVASGNLGAVASMQGLCDEACRRFDAAVEILQEIGDRGGEALARANRGIVALGLGRYAEAMRFFERSLETAREIGNRQLEAEATLRLASVLRNLGRAAEARLHYERCLATSRQIGDRRNEARALVELAALLQNLDARVEAADHLSLGLALARELEHEKVIAQALLLEASRAEAEGGDEDARSFLAEALERARAADESSLEALSACRIAVCSPDAVPAALDALKRAGGCVDHETRLEAHFLLWKATGESGFLTAAKEALDRAAEHAPVAYRTSLIEQVPLHREITGAAAQSGSANPPPEKTE